MKDDKNRPTPLHERIHGEDVNKKNENQIEDVDDVITGGQAGSPYYKNMHNIPKDSDEESKDKVS